CHVCCIRKSHASLPLPLGLVVRRHEEMALFRTIWPPVLVAVVCSVSFLTIGAIAVERELRYPNEPSTWARLVSPAAFNVFFISLIMASAFWTGHRGAKRGYSRFRAGLCGVAIPIGVLIAVLAAVFLTSGKVEFEELLAWEVVAKISISFGVAIMSSLA